MAKKMTKKTTKTNVRKTLIIGVGIVVLLGIASLASAKVTVLDRIVDKAGETLGNLIYGKVEPAIEPELQEIIGQPLGGSTLSTAWQDQNGVVTYILGGDLPTATTNILFIRNPFGSSASSTADTAYENGEITWQVAIGDIGKKATSTVDLVMISIDTAATSSFLMRCGVAATAYDPPVSTSDILNLEVATGTQRLIDSRNASSTAGVASTDPASRSVALSYTYSFFVCRLYPPAAVGASVWENGIGFNRDGIADVAAGTVSTENPIRWKAKVRITDVP